MATSTGKATCATCGKEKVAYKCEGCSQNFCINHLADHHQLISKELDEIEDKCNIFRQILTEQKTNPQKHSLIEQINRWEHDSMNKIRETAEETRKLLLKHTNEHIDQIEKNLNKFTEQLREIRKENDFNEIILNQFKQKLKQLDEELVKPKNISIQEDSSEFIRKISVVIATTLAQMNITNSFVNAKWIQNGIIVAGGNGGGSHLNQFHNPYGVYVDHDQTIYVADYANDRIVEWRSGATIGRIVVGGTGKSNQNNLLSYPFNVIVDRKSDCLIISDHGNSRVVRWHRRNGTSEKIIISNIGCCGLTMDNNGYLYVSDIQKHEVRRFTIEGTNGTVVAGGNEAGNRRNQLYGPYYVAVDQDHSVYVSEYYNHRVTKWMEGAKEGIIVAGGQGEGNGMAQLYHPRGVIVDQLGTVYVADEDNHRVMRWLKGAAEGSVVVGRNSNGGQLNQLNGPCGLSFDQQNNLYVADLHNQRIQKFNLEPVSNT